MKLTRRTKKLVGLPLGLAIGLVVSSFASTPVARRFEALTVDARVKLRGELPLDRRVVVVDVNDETLTLLGWPIPRGFYAHLIDVAVKHGAKAVGFDVLFMEKSAPEMDALLAKSARDCKCVVFPSQLSPVDDAEHPEHPEHLEHPEHPEAGALNRVEKPLDVFAQASASPAHVQLDNTLDGVFRSVPPMLDADGARYPALAYAVAHVAGIDVPHGDDARRAWISWRAASSSAVHALPLLDVLAAEQALDSGEKPAIDLDGVFRGAMVIVGQSAKSVGDRGPVPLSSDAPLVLAHANLLDNLVNDRLLAPPSPAVVWLLALFLGGLVAVSATALRTTKTLLVSATALLALWLAAYALFVTSSSTWLPLAVPTASAALSFVGGTVLNMWARDADEQRLRQAFERYVAPNILDKILENPQDVDIRGHTRTLTLLFSDIKGYTTLSNTLPAEAIVELLCTYLDTMVDILLKHEGTVDKIMGDGIMAFFGDPLPQKDHALRCVRAALDMQRATAELGEKWVARGLSPLQVRIGVATGEVFVGSIGSRQHLEYTAIGRPVNLASRLEGKAPPGGVLVSAETYELVKEDVVMREARGLDLKGYAGGYDAWLVSGLKGGAQSDVTMDQRRGARRTFFSDVVLTHDGADLVARSSDISPGGMFIQCDVLPPSGARVKVKANLAPSSAPGTAPPTPPTPLHMDAVVTHVRDGGAGLMFTTVFCDDRAAIQALLEGVLGHEAWDDTQIQQTDQGKDGGGAGFTYAIDVAAKHPNQE